MCVFPYKGNIINDYTYPNINPNRPERQNGLEEKKYLYVDPNRNPVNHKTRRGYLESYIDSTDKCVSTHIGETYTQPNKTPDKHLKCSISHIGNT